MYCISVDIGTTTFKVALFRDAKRLRTVEREYAIHCFPDGGVEQDAEDWVRLFERAVGELKADLPEGCAPKIVVSAQSITCVPVDRKGKPLCPALSWLDARAGKECEQLDKLFGPGELFSLTGKRATAQYTLQKILWLRNNRPEIFAKTYKFLLPADFLIATLTGNFYTEHTFAAGTLLYGLRERDWNARILSVCDLNRALLPDILEAGASAGKLTREAAHRLGLFEDCEVLFGCQDQKTAALAAGISREVATLSLGTAGAIEFLIREPVFDPDQGLPCFPYPGGGFVLEGVLPTAGACIKWLKNLLNTKNYDELDTLAESAPAGANGVRFLPNLSGEGSPDYKERAASVSGLSLNTGRADLVRAAFEGIALLILKNLRRAQALGATPTRLSLFGGGAKSPILCQIIADVCNMPVLRLEDPETVLLGNAAIAGAILPDSPARTVLPDPARSAFYREFFSAC